MSCKQYELVTADGQYIPSTEVRAGCALQADYSLWPTIDLIGPSHVLILEYLHKKLRVSHTSAATVTVPPAILVAFPPGTPILIEWEVNSVGVVSVAEGAGVTIDTAETFELRKPGSIGALILDTGNRWAWTGDLNLA